MVEDMLKGEQLVNHLKYCMSAGRIELIKLHWYQAVESYGTDEFDLALSMRAELAEYLGKYLEGDNTKDWETAFNVQLHTVCVYTADGRIPIHRQTEREDLPRFRDYGEQLASVPPAVVGMDSQGLDLLNYLLSKHGPDVFEKLGVPAVKVDLSYDDKTLLEQFGQWLKAVRQCNGKTSTTYQGASKKRAQRCKKLKEHRILQYLDCRMVSLFLCPEQGREVAARALYPDKHYSESHIRNTIAKLARLFIDDATVRSRL